MPGRYLNHAYEYRQGLHQFPYSQNWYNQLFAGVSTAAYNYYTQESTAPRLADAYSASYTQTTKKQRSEEKPRGTMEWTRVSRRRGKKMRKSVANIYKLTEGITGSMVFRWQNVNPFATPSCGYQKIYNHRFTNAGQPYFLPMHVYDISTWNGPLAERAGICHFGNATVQQVGFRADFVQPYGLRNQSTTSLGSAAGNPSWQYEFTPKGTPPLTQPASDILEWVEISMLCYGRLGIPTRWRIQLCQIPDEDYNPYMIDEDVSTTGAAGDAIAAFQAASAPFHANPIMKFDTQHNPGRVFKTIMVEDFILGSDNLDYNSANVPQMRQVRMFSRLNRRQNYQWRGQDFIPAADLNVGANEAANEFGQQSNAPEAGPHPKSRIYLVVQAMSTLTTTTDMSIPAPTFSANTQPSYDIVIRKKHTGLQT